MRETNGLELDQEKAEPTIGRNLMDQEKAEPTIGRN